MISERDARAKDQQEKGKMMVSFREDKNTMHSPPTTTEVSISNQTPSTKIAATSPARKNQLNISTSNNASPSNASQQFLVIQQQQKVKEKDLSSKNNSPLLGSSIITFDELMEFIKKIVILSDTIKESKLKKNGSIIHVRLLHIEDEITHWGKELIKQSNDKQIGKALQLLYQHLTKVYSLLSKIQRCKWFIDMRFSKKAKKLTEELDNVTTILGVSITYFKAQSAYSNVHKLGIVSGYPDIDIFDLDDKNNLALAADRFYIGHGVTQNFEMAFRLYLHAARLGEARSQYVVGTMLIEGVGVEKDSRQGVKWTLKSASQDYPDALNQMGIFYEKGFVVEENPTLAAKFYLRATHMAHLDGMTNYASLLLHGNGVEKNEQKAAWLLRKACERNYAKAQNELGVMYYKGLGIEENPDKAVELFTSSADRGNVYALNNLGIAYEEGRGVVRDYAKATLCYEKSSKLGNVNALNNLGYIKLLQKQYDEALELLHQAADRGSIDAMYNIGNVYRIGLGVNADPSLSLKFLYRAANLGHKKAQKLVGDILYSGVGAAIPSNRKEAASFYYKAAINGDADACNNLGIMYEDGCSGVEKDEEKAVLWFRKASNLGSDNGMFNLAAIYERRNKKEQATTLLRKASMLGNIKARERVGPVAEIN